MQSFDRLARAVAGHPRTVLLLLVTATLALALKLPSLRADSSPRALLASAEPEQQRSDDRARALFGSSNNTVVVVLSGEHVLERAPLAYAHALMLALKSLPHVERVDGLTRVPWPMTKADDLTLDDLDTTGGSRDSPELLDAASELVASAPELFPAGLSTLAERTSAQHIEPVVPGEHVSESDAAFIRDVVAKSERLDRKLLSQDRKHLLIAAQLSDALASHNQLADAVSGVEQWLAKHEAPEGVRVSLSGLPVVRTSLVRYMREDQRLLIPGTLLASLIVLALSFRWAPAMFLPVLAVGVTALWLLSGMALFGEPLNVLNNMLPALVIIIGLNEAVHIIGRYAEECRGDGDKARALEATVRAMGAACLTTTATSAIGLLSLLVSRTEMLRRFGVVGAAGLFLAYAITLLVVPPFLSLLRAPPRDAVLQREKRGRIERLLSRFTSSALQKPWLLLCVALVSAVAAGSAAQRLVVDTRLLDQFSSGDPVHQGVRLLEREFEGVRPLEITLESEQPGRMFDPAVVRVMQRMRAWAEQQNGVLGVSEVSEPLGQAWAALSGRPNLPEELRSRQQVEALHGLLRARDPSILNGFVTADGRHARVRVRLEDMGSRATKLFVQRANQKLARELLPFDDVHVTFGGDAYLGSRGLDTVVSDLSGSLLVAALMIFLVLAALLRDLKLALLSIPANLLPQVWTMAWMVVRDIPLNASSAIIFSLSIGLAVDGSIHLVSRFQEEQKRAGLVTTAIVRAVRGSGRNVVVSSCALVLGFSVMLLSNFVPVQRFAELITVSMAGSVLATLAIQPVLLRVFLTRKASTVPEAVRAT